MDNLTKESRLQTQMCLQILILYGESTALVAILQAQNHISEIGCHLSLDYTNIKKKGSGSPACNCKSSRWGLSTRAPAIPIARDPDSLSDYRLKRIPEARGRF